MRGLFWHLWGLTYLTFQCSLWLNRISTQFWKQHLCYYVNQEIIQSCTLMWDNILYCPVVARCRLFNPISLSTIPWLILIPLLPEEKKKNIILNSLLRITPSTLRKQIQYFLPTITSLAVNIFFGFMVKLQNKRILRTDPSFTSENRSRYEC